MKNLHGFARELAFTDLVLKQNLLDKAGREWGLEDESTIALYRMNTVDTSYVALHDFYLKENARKIDEYGG